MVLAVLAAFLAMFTADPVQANDNHALSRQAKEDSVSEAEQLYRRYRTETALGYFLLSGGVALAIPAIGYGVAWSRTPEEEGDPNSAPQMASLDIQLSQRQEYKVTTIVFSSLSLAFIACGSAIVAVVHPKLKRVKKMQGEPPSFLSRHPVLMLEPFVDSDGGGGQLRISF